MGLSADELQVIWLSLRVSAVATLLTLAPGVAAGWLLARRQFPGKGLAEGVLMLPLVLPPVVTGYLLLLVLGANGPVGRLLEDALGMRFAFTWLGAAVAAAVVGFPLMVRAVRVSVEAVDAGLEDAARTLGASPVRVFFTVTLPLALPGVLSGTVLAFARSLGEFGATITFVGNIVGQTRTLPLALYTFAQTPGRETEALRLVIISSLLALLTLWASERLAHRARESLHGK